MLLRDLGRLQDTAKRMNECPLGSCALAATTYPINRELVGNLLDFDGITQTAWMAFLIVIFVWNWLLLFLF